MKSLALIDQLPVAVFIIDKDHKVCYWNNKCEIITGVPKEKIIGTSDHSIAFYEKRRPLLADLVLDQEDRILELYPDCKKIDGWYTGTAYFPFLKGGEKFFQFSAKPIYENKKLVGVMEILFDITHLKQIDNFNEDIYENSMEAICVFDMESLEICFVNKSALEIYGYKLKDRQQVIGQSILNFSVVRAEEIKTFIQKIIKNGIKSFQTIHIKKNGKRIHVSGNCRKIKYLGRDCILVNIKDISNEIKAFEEKNRTCEEILKVLSRSIDYRDSYTEEHSERVKNYAVKLAKELLLPESLVEEIRIGSLLHDLGKLGIPDQIINKQGLLSVEEYEKIKEHPRIGYRIIEPVQISRNIKAIILFHHERWDGQGYPLGLKGDEIPLPARIVAIADAFDAMTSNRVYRKACSKEEALKEIQACSGSQFDPQLSKVFIKMIEKEINLNKNL
ncbi:hypothetical protein BBF96_01010 [Anoxybacter fermentans]|uniref:Histidine kinase n=2 Tax=Anoxybacter fermentans TaxID=1323375 RepID=A0A3S9SUV7_9FIRM|nr:hypothetical protein BBF96_01010 [Anoxybacter fermentans]